MFKKSKGRSDNVSSNRNISERIQIIKRAEFMFLENVREEMKKLHIHSFFNNLKSTITKIKKFTRLT